MWQQIHHHCHENASSSSYRRYDVTILSPNSLKSIGKNIFDAKQFWQRSSSLFSSPLCSRALTHSPEHRRAQAFQYIWTLKIRGLASFAPTFCTSFYFRFNSHQKQQRQEQPKEQQTTFNLQNFFFKTFSVLIKLSYLVVIHRVLVLVIEAQQQQHRKR